MSPRSGLAVAAFVLGSCGLVACSLAVSTDGLTAGSRAADDAGSDVNQGTLVDGASDARSDAEGGGASTVLLAAGLRHTCAVVNGRASCWGANEGGQLGDGTTTGRKSPVPVQGLPAGQLTAIGAGEHHTCAIVDGKVWCWGSGAAGALGPNGLATSNVRPVEVTGLPGPADDVQGGASFTCAKLDQRVYCWGANDNSKLGDGTTTSHKAATVVVDTAGILGDVVQLAVGGDHACVRKASGEPWCWGHNDSGTIGNPAAGAATAKAMPVLDLPGPAQRVAIGAWHACAIVNGGAWCWGTGDMGQLGHGQDGSSTRPVPVLGHADGVTQLWTAGGADELDATCAVRNGQLSCWGAGQSFRLGDGQTSSRSTPQAMTTLPATVRTLAGGAAHWCAHLANDEVRCWGRGNDGQLGDGAGVDRALPVVVTGL